MMVLPRYQIFYSQYYNKLILPPQLQAFNRLAFVPYFIQEY